MPVDGHFLLQHAHIVQAETDKLVGQHGLVEELGREAAEEMAEDGLRFHSGGFAWIDNTDRHAAVYTQHGYCSKTKT